MGFANKDFFPKYKVKSHHVPIFWQNPSRFTPKCYMRAITSFSVRQNPSRGSIFGKLSQKYNVMDSTKQCLNERMNEHCK